MGETFRTVTTNRITGALSVRITTKPIRLDPRTDNEVR